MARFTQQLGAAYTVLAALAAPGANARELAIPYGECRAGYWSSTRNLDDDTGVAKATCFASWKQPLGEHLRFNLGGRFGARDAGDAQGGSGRVREAYLEADAGPLRLRLGRQIIAWGRADRINPTDNLSPRDYTTLVPEDEEQRLGITALAANYRLGDSLGLVALLIPRFEPHKTPLGSLPRKLVAARAPGQGEWALKLEKSGGAWDGSISYYDGFDRFARYSAAFPAPASLLFKGEFETMKTIGADVATSAGGWGLRAEFAHSRFASACSPCGNNARTVRRLVLGVDRDVGESANINAQLFGIERSDFAETGAIGKALNRLNSEFGKREYGVSLRVYDRYWNDRLKAELGAIFDLSGDSGLVRPRATYSISDALKATAGIDYFYGGEQSFFGARGRNRVAFIELAYVF